MLSCLLIRYFATTIERKHNPDLMHTPLAIVTNSTRPRVIATSEIPKQAGVTPNITVKQAEVLCPTIEAITANHETYERIAIEIAELLLAYTHKVEVEYQATATAWYVEAISAEELAQLQAVIYDYLGVIPTIGIGSNKFVARVASASNFQDKALQVKAGDEASFLAQFPVTLLPLDKDMKRRLPLLGIETLGQYAKLPKGSILEQFGKHGRWLYELANGKDIRPIQAHKPAPTLRQSYSFDDAIGDYETIKAVFKQLVELHCHQLNQRQAESITLILELEDKSRLEKHIQPAEAVIGADVLQRHLETLLYRQAIPSGILTISVILGDLKERVPQQLSMFDTNANKQSVFKMLPKWQGRYHDTDFLQAIITETPVYYIPEQQYQLKQAVSA